MEKQRCHKRQAFRPFTDFDHLKTEAMENTNDFQTPGPFPETVSNDDKTLAAIAHAGGIFFSFIPSLIIWLIKRDHSTFVANEAKEALNFQITVAIAMFVSTILIVILVGALFIWLVWLLNIIFCIVGTVKAAQGTPYRYPATLRLVK